MERKGAHQGCTAQDCTRFLAGAEQQSYRAWRGCGSPASTPKWKLIVNGSKGQGIPRAGEKTMPRKPESVDTGAGHPLPGKKPVDNWGVKYQVKTSMAARTRILPNREDRRTPLCYGHIRSSCFLHFAHPTETYHVAVRLYEPAPKSFLRTQDRVCT